jgi:hypothetical protein
VPNWYLLIFFFSLGKAQAITANKDWPTYVDCIVHIQKKHPNLFRPLETIRIDQLPTTDLVQQVEHFSKLWRTHAKDLRFRHQIEESRDKVSEEANRQLRSLVAKIEAQKGKPALQGSTLKIVKSIPEESRLAMTPLDDLFQKSTEVGKKIASDSRVGEQGGYDSYLVDDKNRSIVFKRSQDNNQLDYRLKVVDAFATGRLRLRGLLGSLPDPVGADISVETANMRGSFFNPSSNDVYPFGKYPRGKDLWVDERGVQHFSGDGHKH